MVKLRNITKKKICLFLNQIIYDWETVETRKKASKMYAHLW
jgi:hypothetical protein